MLSTGEALEGWSHDEYGPYLPVGDYEIRLEPLLFENQWYLAIYDKEKNLVAPKVVVKPGKDINLTDNLPDVL